MKPVKLVMSAFGPFADKVTIDFTKLGNAGLYLVTGDTGAGKTTIFDAIMVLLVGNTVKVKCFGASMLQKKQRPSWN